MTVSDLITSAFQQASGRYPVLHEAWIQISHRIGVLLPKSQLLNSVQQYGELDLVLRCMEDELAPVIGRAPVEYRTQIFFSEVWVSGIYETMRLLLNDRKLVPDSGEYRALFNDFELLRIPIDKHDIAKQKAPLEIMTYDQKDPYVFTKGDPQRSHIMYTAVSVQGSLKWQVIDVKADKTRWIERRSLSDRMITLWGKQGSLKAD